MLRAGEKIDSFTLVRQLGKGSFDVVWLAEERTKLARAPKVALKIAFEDRVEISEVEQEAELWVEASGHVNVLPILSARFHDDQIIIVTEYAPDGSLEQWFGEQKHKAAFALKIEVRYDEWKQMATRNGIRDKKNLMLLWQCSLFSLRDPAIRLQRISLTCAER